MASKIVPSLIEDITSMDQFFTLSELIYHLYAVGYVHSVYDTPGEGEEGSFFQTRPPPISFLIYINVFVKYFFKINRIILQILVLYSS